MSILLQDNYTTPFGTIPFTEIKTSDYLPSLKEAIKIAKSEVELIKQTSEAPSFLNTIVAYEKSGKLVNRISTVFHNMFSANSDDEIVEIAKDFSPLLTAYDNDLSLDPILFERVKSVYDSRESLDLNREQLTLLEKTYKGFSRNGANLSESKKEELRGIDEKLSTLKVQFGDNSLKETNSYELVVDSLDKLSGLPEGAIEAAVATAKEKGHEGKWVFTLDAPSYIALVRYADNRELRKEITIAYGQKACKGDENDNQGILKEIATLRHQRAQLLGYTDHSHYTLEERMAMTSEKVVNFLEEIYTYALPVGKKEVAELTEFAKKLDGPAEIMAWDFAYYAEKLKKEKFDVNDEALKPYLKLENVIDGAFQVANKLFGLNFEERQDIPKYHKDVLTYDVTDENGKHVSVFYADFFPRESKRGGAWMTSYKEQSGEERPHISIVCNFTKPTETKPSLLTFGEVTTLFHEFGHALHGMLADGEFSSLSGTNVFWDFVELPSQIYENWAYEKECLDLFAVHYETGEKIPAELVKKLKDSSNFHEGRATLRQLSFAFLDMAWHSKDPSGVDSVEEFEDKAMSKANILPKTPGTMMSTAFGHIFQGGYSSGYYSYKWAEVLDADAFDYFKQNGIFNKEIAKKFKDNILSRGGTEHPMELYKKFRGQEPSVEPLLKRAGLL